MYAKEIKLALNEIRDAIKDKDRTLAIEKCQSLLKEHPKNYVCLVLLGTVYQTTDKAQATLHLRKAVGCSDKPTLALKELAKCVPVDDLPEIYEKLLLFIPANAFEYYGKLASVGASNPTIRQKCIEILKKEALNANTTDAKRSSYLSLAKIWVLQDEIDEADQELFNSCLEVAMADNSNPELQLDSLKSYLKQLYKLKDYANLISKADYMFDLYPDEPCSLEWICKLYCELNKTNAELISALPLPIDFYAQKLEELSPKSSLATKTRSVIKAVDSEVQAKAITIKEKIPHPKSVVRANSSTPIAAVSADRSKAGATSNAGVSPASTSKFTQGAHPKSVVRANSSNPAAAVSADRSKAVATANAGVSPASTSKFNQGAQQNSKTHQQTKLLLDNARRKVLMYEGVNPSQLSSWERARYDQAKSMLVDVGLKLHMAENQKAAMNVASRSASSNNESATSFKNENNGESFHNKRVITDDATLTNGAKRWKTSSSPSVHDDTNDELLVAVLNEQEPLCRISKDQWKDVEEKLQNALWKVLATENSDLQFDGSDWNDGHKVVTCGNTASADFIRRFISDVGELWKGAKLRCATAAELVQIVMPKAWVWVPCPFTCPDRLIGLLHVQNRQLKADTWKVLKIGTKRENGQYYLLALNSQSLSYLEKCKGLVRYSLGRVLIKLPAQTNGIEDQEPMDEDGVDANQLALGRLTPTDREA